MRELLLKTLPAVAMLLAGCEKEIDFKYRDIEPILVIEGAVTQDGTSVSLTETTPMDEPKSGWTISPPVLQPSCSPLATNLTAPTAHWPEGSRGTATGCQSPARALRRRTRRSA